MPSRDSSKGLGEGEIPAYHIHVGWQTSRIRIACERADSHVPRRHLSEYLAADSARSPNDENAIHQENSSAGYRRYLRCTRMRDNDRACP